MFKSNRLQCQQPSLIGLGNLLCIFFSGTVKNTCFEYCGKYLMFIAYRFKTSGSKYKNSKAIP